MQRRFIGGLIGLSLVGTSALAAGAAFGAPAAEQPGVSSPDTAPPSDDLPNPLAEKRNELRETAITGVLDGELTPEVVNGSKVVKVGESVEGDDSLGKDGPKISPQAAGSAKGEAKASDKQKKQSQYVELEREATDRIFVILAEFGDERHPDYPDQDTDPTTPGPLVFDGPQVNQIPEPDRSKDNSTIWQEDFSQEHFDDLYFGDDESLRTYYETQSSGRYSVEGTVTDWVKVKYNEARYGRSNGFPCASTTCSNVWALVDDAAQQWVADQKAAGMTNRQIKKEMQSFDQWDRYDFDGDGDFNEPDGYIDHFQIVHAGGDQADGDPQQGEDAIWSHRWYANQVFNGTVGPETNPLGGFQVGKTGIYIGDYTIQPENGGRSVFYHEYGHDLGLPDDYNVLSGGDNNNEHWTLMAQSRLNDEGEALGERGGDLGAWNKLQLGWLDYEVVPAGQKRNLVLGPQEYNSKDAQAAVVVLPKKEITAELGAPASGEQQFYSDTGDDLDNSMSREVTVPADDATLSFKARYDIEVGYDYAFVEVNDGSGFAAVDTSISTDATTNGIDGTSQAWTDATADLSEYAGQTVTLRFRYVTDGAVAGNGGDVPSGLFVDDITLGDLSDGAEDGLAGWDSDGFLAVGAESTEDFSHYYIAGQRSYTSYDQYLETGPYYFGYTGTDKPDFVDHYAYQEGLLISYWDTSFADNDTFAHPGQGRNLIIDAHPRPIYQLTTGQPWRARVQVYDAPFSKTKADSFTLHQNGEANYIRGQAGNPVFDDTDKYFYEELPNHGVKLPGVGVKIKVQNENGSTMKIKIS
ncbi:immune inhibitor A [Paraoerskovia marina]|uniref:Immune inhibitor A n=1 Tax=Paraoerskovia marina TaxID=545619 RepID=A0A1H1M9F3_9CELL|nr:immune inhibitor A domain-containing protein [Paraoerskovia marina]SDR83431.1 immune inhibitor A [Paraoerskovia marina]